jgi:hypothetical protein
MADDAQTSYPYADASSKTIDLALQRDYNCTRMPLRNATLCQIDVSWQSQYKNMISKLVLKKLLNKETKAW